jgi:hypothetical protein
MSDSLEALAARASRDPWFLAFALAAYQERHALDNAALARELGCNDAAVLTLLHLCRRPGTAPGRTAEENIAEIARRFAIDPAALRLLNLLPEPASSPNGRGAKARLSFLRRSEALQWLQWVSCSNRWLPLSPFPSSTCQPLPSTDPFHRVPQRRRPPPQRLPMPPIIVRQRGSRIRFIENNSIASAARPLVTVRYSSRRAFPVRWAPQPIPDGGPVVMRCAR